MREKTTCGPLYAEGFKSFAGDDPEKQRVFASGFISGQAEKVYLGAAPAAMFRPSPERLDMIVSIVNEVIIRYGLQSHFLETSGGTEVWICRNDHVAKAISRLRDIAENSEAWHHMRGILCGIPAHELDPKFHKRTGYGEQCD